MKTLLKKSSVCAYIAFFAMALSACSATPSNAATEKEESKQFLASNLYYERSSENYEFSLKIDPFLSEAPAFVRAIRAENMVDFDPKKCEGAYKCFITKNIEAGAHAKLIVSAIATTNEFYGGNHPGMVVKSYLFHKGKNEFLKFSELFSDWPEAQKVLQREWCNQVKDHAYCPVISDQALLLTEGIKGISGLTVKTSDGAFGSYAEGPATKYISFNEELLALLKSEYRPLFAVEEPCC
jgi:hypothetical protein